MDPCWGVWGEGVGTNTCIRVIPRSDSTSQGPSRGWVVVAHPTLVPLTRPLWDSSFLRGRCPDVLSFSPRGVEQVKGLRDHQGSRGTLTPTARPHPSAHRHRTKGYRLGSQTTTSPKVYPRHRDRDFPTLVPK